MQEAPCKMISGSGMQVARTSVIGTRIIKRILSLSEDNRKSEILLIKSRDRTAPLVDIQIRSLNSFIQ
ncbi:hypothetical protein ACN38_g7080 [Penicillium nordicum]|uniref:Uncharacterized protein n=1 Tax=Penicillium nordicum TaxID=229535 RepID=A0A0M9WEQ5_9EURO|nr:hypothetical protein ACN38_g7080 [Penicillium nordicum]